MNPGAASGPARFPVRPLLLYAAIVVAVRLASWPPLAAIPPGPDVLAAVLLLYTPLIRYRRTGVPGWVRFGNVRTNLAVGAALAAGGAVLFLAWARLPVPEPLRPRAGALPPLGMFLAAQAALVALPEEVFFRGYLYDAFAEKGWEPVIATSLFFAVAHVAIHATAYRAMTFFPGLVFGWARKKTGSVFIPAAVHLAYNTLPYLGGNVP